jgi:hypothetical protein
MFVFHSLNSQSTGANHACVAKLGLEMNLLIFQMLCPSHSCPIQNTAVGTSARADIYP